MFVATADAMVYESSPTTNYGSGYELRARTGAGRQYESYLTFNVSGTSGGVSNATLTLTSASYQGSDTASAPEVRLVTGAWTESGITWATRPATGGLAAPGGRRGAWGHRTRGTSRQG